VLDSFALPPTSASETSRMDAPPAGKAGGASIEIFTSFRSLVDSLSRDADGARHASRRTAGSDQAADTVDAKGDAASADDAGSIVVPLDLAALMLSRAAVANGTGGSTPLPVTDPDGHASHTSTAGDLAALLLAARNGSTTGAAPGTDGSSVPAGDVVALSTAGAPGDAALALEQAGLAGEALAGAAPSPATLAQALAQQFGAGAKTSPSADAAGPAGSRLRSAAEELLKQMATGTDRPPSAAVTPTSRLTASMMTALMPASAAPMLAGQTGAPAPVLVDLPSAGTTDQIIQAIRLQWTKGGGEAHIRLEPRQFGDLTVSVSVNQGQVVARLQADTPIAREWLQANHQVLRQGLADQQLTLARLEVSEPSAETRHGAPRDGQPSQQDGRRPRRPRTPDVGETFDIVA